METGPEVEVGGVFDVVEATAAACAAWPNQFLI